MNRKYNPLNIIKSLYHYYRCHWGAPRLCPTCYHYSHIESRWEGLSRFLCAYHWCSHSRDFLLRLVYDCVWYHKEFEPKTCAACCEESTGKGGGE